MNYPISGISMEAIAEGYSFHNLNGSTSSNLEELNKINVFVGPNNSGKSRLMRQIASAGKLSFTLTEGLGGLDELRRDISTVLEEFVKRQKISDMEGLIGSAKK